MGIDEEIEVRSVEIRVDPVTGRAEPVIEEPNCIASVAKPSLPVRTMRVVKKFMSFLGPGLMVSVAYMDPGNYSTDVAAGAAKRFALLFVILLSTIIALYLQTLAIKLGTVTGTDLARNCRLHLPRYIGYILYVFAEAAIIATDIAEVIGTAIALNILLKIPLIAGVFITIVDVILVLFAYRPGNAKAVRFLEMLIAALLIAVVICFCILLGKMPEVSAGKVLRGYLPSGSVISDGGMYMSAGIMGATVMPHSLYLGSAMVITRVNEYDKKHTSSPEKVSDLNMDTPYEPSGAAIRSTYRYSVAELFISLCTVAIFVNSAILIVSASILYGSEEAQNADLYTIYDMLTEYLSKGAAVTFMVALLCSGQSAGVICTLAGQIVAEGHINWRVRPWIRRIITRLIAIVPCVAVVASLGRVGLGKALNWSQVVLTITLPFLAAPLVYLTSSKKVMRVAVKSYDVEELDQTSSQEETHANNWVSMIFGWLVCLFILIVNIYLLVQIGLEGTP